MKLTREKIRAIVPNVDFQRGLEYYRQGRVRDYHGQTQGGFTEISCTVRGSEDYAVKLTLFGSYRVIADCECPRFEDTGCCKHVVAAMLRYADGEVGVRSTDTDLQGRKLLNSYVARVSAAQAADPDRKARLVPRIHCWEGMREYPQLAFQVGYERLYVVKNVSTFVANFETEKTVAYGKQLTLRHALSEFDERSRKLIGILSDYVQMHRLFYRRLQYYAREPEVKGELVLNPDAFDQLFTLYEGTELELLQQKDRILLQNGDPQLTLQVSEKKQSMGLELQALRGMGLFGDGNRLYVLQGGKLLRCSSAFVEKVKPLLTQGSASMQIAEEDLTTFCSCVLPEIQDYVTVEDPKGMLQKYSPEVCVPCFYFDMEDDTLTAKLTYRYGDTELSWETPSGSGTQIRRNIRTEQAAQRQLLRSFSREEGASVFTMTGDDAIYGFLSEGVAGFQQLGEVYVSDRLKNKQVHAPAASVGISVSDGLLSLDIDTGGFPVEELEALYRSLLRRRKYHKLADGRYLTLDGSPCETLAEVAHMTQLSAKDLKSGHVTVPAYRSLYLDNALGKKDGLRVERDAQFRNMIRRFKTVDESEDVIPAPFAGVLRPYQETGFRWLKTLESCHFGGILADEMGLGKTLQMIAFLSTATCALRGKPSLVVCPASLVLNWADEFEKFAKDMRVSLIIGNAGERKRRIEAGGSSDVWVTSYDLLKRDIELYADRSFYCCVLDEGQFIKNQATLASKAVKRIACQQRFVLTGTPIENRLSELWNLFDFLMPGYLFAHNRFVERLEKPIVQSGDQEAGEQLRRLVRPFLLRRMKGDVLKELPPKLEHVRKIQQSEEERKIYLAAANAAKGSFAQGRQEKLQILAALTHLRQICCDPNLCYENYTGEASKLDACIELCVSMTENGHQILLFSQFTSMLDRIRQRLVEAKITSYTLQGSTPREKRAQLVKDFNAGGAQVFLISLKAGGTGLNLTAADVVIHYDPWWNLAAQNQATDRAHRIGQQSCVQVYKLIAKDTIEEKILELQARKAALMDTVSGDLDQSILSMSQEELLALLD